MDQDPLAKFSESDERSESSGTSGPPGSRGDYSTSNATSTSGQELLEEKERMFQQESIQVSSIASFVFGIIV
jgi:hypothetical protein